MNCFHVISSLSSTYETVRKLQFWDVMNGVTRRAWSGNDNAQYVFILFRADSEMDGGAGE